MNTAQPQRAFCVGLHEIRAGHLPEIFGPQGSFIGAPPWAGPVYGTVSGDQTGYWFVKEFQGESSVLLWGDGQWQRGERDRLVLDYRCLEVAGRMAGLCAQHMGAENGGAYRVFPYRPLTSEGRPNLEPNAHTFHLAAQREEASWEFRPDLDKGVWRADGYRRPVPLVPFVGGDGDPPTACFLASLSRVLFGHGAAR